MKLEQVRQSFLDFFESKDHKIIQNSSLVPREDDPTGLFTNSGMHPLKPYFLGKLTPPNNRMTNCQRCIRTGDIEDVGMDGRHLTCFEMLGNWSIDDYWKQDAIKFAWELLTNIWNIPEEKLFATVFGGEGNVEEDLESIDVLKKLLPENKIVKLKGFNGGNFWSAGPVGPCGPCVEFYYKQDIDDCKDTNGCGLGKCDCDKYLEIWNAAVCMQYDRKEDGTLYPLPFKSIDAGAGLERVTMVLQNKNSIYDVDSFQSIIRKIKEISNKENIGNIYDHKNKDWQNIAIICDHMRASVLMIGDGIIPSNIERGYILRRLIRRSIRAGYNLGIRDRLFLKEVANEVINMFLNEYSYLNAKRDNILNEIGNEENKFIKTLERGIKEFEKIVSNITINKNN